MKSLLKNKKKQYNEINNPILKQQIFLQEVESTIFRLLYNQSYFTIEFWKFYLNYYFQRVDNTSQ